MAKSTFADPGHSGIEAHVTLSLKKVQSKDLKSTRLIGKGLSSMVYEMTREGKSYARKDFLRVPLDIFEREAAALVGLDHPNLVRTYCWAAGERSCSLVLELMNDDVLNMIRKRKHSQRKKTPGSDSASPTSPMVDLQKFIEDSKNAPGGTASGSDVMPVVYPFNLEEALQIILQIAKGMKFLHDSGVVHGDLKPKNILVTSSGGVASSPLDENMAFKVADFGLVATKMKSRSLVPRQARQLEMVRWRAPERLDFREDQECESSTKLDWDSDSSTETISVNLQDISSEDMKRADVYNFALTCYQILTGEDPYPDLDVNELVRELSLGMRPKLPHPTCPPLLSDLLKLCWSDRDERPSFEDILSKLIDLQASVTLNGALSFSFDDIKKMTNNFNDDNFIGEGRYGKVYKGIQADTGAMLAVKRAQEGSKLGAQEFKKEIEVLSRIHHNNLVGLVGFCLEKSEQMLVYEYMPNGTLTDWLRGPMSEPSLDWKRRLQIALGAARGIVYLHHNADPKIIHGDVKSCNILLDKELNAKVADFGLSMLVQDDKGRSHKRTIKGTKGYKDPEYEMWDVLSTKSDVYSFGVVLLELITGRPPTDKRGWHLHWKVWGGYEEAGMAGVRELLDPLLVDFPLETFLKNVLLCMDPNPRKRPSMHKVVELLESSVLVKAQLIP